MANRNAFNRESDELYERNDALMREMNRLHRPWVRFMGAKDVLFDERNAFHGVRSRSNSAEDASKRVRNRLDAPEDVFHDARSSFHEAPDPFMPRVHACTSARTRSMASEAAFERVRTGPQERSMNYFSGAVGLIRSQWFLAASSMPPRGAPPPLQGDHRPDPLDDAERPSAL